MGNPSQKSCRLPLAPQTSDPPVPGTPPSLPFSVPLSHRAPLPVCLPVSCSTFKFPLQGHERLEANPTLLLWQKQLS